MMHKITKMVLSVKAEGPATLINTIKLLDLTAEELWNIVLERGRVMSLIQELAGRFGPPVQEFKLEVPGDYKHDESLGIATPLEAGKTYKVTIIPVKKQVSFKNAKMYLAGKGSIPAGLQALKLLRPSDPVTGKFTVSFGTFNKKRNDGIKMGRSSLIFTSVHGWAQPTSFHMNIFELEPNGILHWAHHLLCITEA